MRVTNVIPFGCSLLLPVGTVNRVQTLNHTHTGPASIRTQPMLRDRIAHWFAFEEAFADELVRAPSPITLLEDFACRLYGARFPTEIYTRGCHWIPRMFA
jgi:hypothetical protein